MAVIIDALSIPPMISVRYHPYPSYIIQRAGQYTQRERTVVTYTLSISRTSESEALSPYCFRAACISATSITPVVTVTEYQTCHTHMEGGREGGREGEGEEGSGE